MLLCFKPFTNIVFKSLRKQIYKLLRLKEFPMAASLARTSFGPIMQGPLLSEISLYLAGPWLFGKDMDSLLWTEDQDQPQAQRRSVSSSHRLQNPKCRLFFKNRLVNGLCDMCLADFIDWRQHTLIHSWLVFSTQLVNCCPHG